MHFSKLRKSDGLHTESTLENKIIAVLPSVEKFEFWVGRSIFFFAFLSFLEYYIEAQVHVRETYFYTYHKAIQ